MRYFLEFLLAILAKNFRDKASSGKEKLSFVNKNKGYAKCDGIGQIVILT